jgi:NTE family protein
MIGELLFFLLCTLLALSEMHAVESLYIKGFAASNKVGAWLFVVGWAADEIRYTGSWVVLRVTLFEEKTRMEKLKIGLVLAGGAARGAYEVGVVQYIIEEISRSLKKPIHFDVLCGTSVGAINACAMGAFAHQPIEGIARLVTRWETLRIHEILEFDSSDVLALVKSFSGRAGLDGAERAGLINPSRLKKILEDSIPFRYITENLKKQVFSAISVSATHVSTGRTIVFVQRSEGGLPSWSSDPTVVPVPVTMRVEHALASAALPIIFPPVRLDGLYYVDGGLRQNVPLSPARRLGADALIVINPRHISTEPEPVRGEVLPSPITLLGKVFNALLLDRIDNDINRLDRINRMLEAGQRRYGENFVDELNQEMGLSAKRSLRPVNTLMIRSSHDIGRLCGEFVQSKDFEGRVGFVMTKFLRRIAEADANREADLLSYLLFDGGFARRLISLGYEDARARHDEFCEFFSSLS